MSQKEITNNLKDVNQWLRIAYMVLFAVCLYVANIVLYLMALVQAVFAILTGAPNTNLRKLGAGLSEYVNQLARFLTYSSEVKPFPLSDWPNASPEPQVTQAEATEEETAAEAPVADIEAGSEATDVKPDSAEPNRDSKPI